MTDQLEEIDGDDPLYRITPMQQVLASCTGAVVTSLFVTPLDVVKVRLQAQRKTSNKCYLYCNGLMDHFCNCVDTKWYDNQPKFNGTIDAFSKITKYEGVTSLWSGLGPTLVLALPATVIYFVTYEQFRLKLKDRYNSNKPKGSKIEQPMWIPLIAGGSARVLSVTIVSPLELIRTKMQSTKSSYFEIGQALRVLVQQSGITGLWKGVFATLLRDVPFSAVYWTSYEHIKSYFNTPVPSFSFSFLAGAVSGGLAACITVPFDVVKTHQQIELGNSVFSSKYYQNGKLITENTNTHQVPKTESTFNLIGQIYRQHGLTGLFAGVVPRLIKVAPACAIMISTFEYSKLFFRKIAEKKEKQRRELIEVNLHGKQRELF